MIRKLTHTILLATILNTTPQLTAQTVELCRADLNGNNSIDIWDVAEIATVFGRVDAYYSLADLNDDGDIDIWDVAVLAKLYGQVVPPYTTLRFAEVSSATQGGLGDYTIATAQDTLQTWQDAEGAAVGFLTGDTAGDLQVSHPTHLSRTLTSLPIGIDTTLSVNLSANTSVHTVQVSVQADSQLGTISEYLTGFNSLFQHVTDSIRADGRLAQYLRDVRTKILRFPGGEVSSHYHWELPGYGGWHDALDSTKNYYNPTLDPALAPDTPGAVNMDTDEFIAFCREVGAEPMIGVNLESWFKAGRVEEGIQEAVRWIQHCVDNNYNVKYWFMDNESDLPNTYHHLTYLEYTDLVIRYGQAMKAVDPNIKIVINWAHPISDPENWAEYDYLLYHARDYIDIADYHQYWTKNAITYEKWVDQSPMHHKANEKSFAEEIRWFKDKIARIDYDIELAIFEWNRGSNELAPLSPFQNALIETEMLHQFIQGGLDYACFWPLIWNNPIQDKEFVDLATMEPRPIYDVFKLYADAMGTEQVVCTSSQPHIPALAAATADGDTLRVYLLHKSLEEIWVNLDLEIAGFSAAQINAVSLTAHQLADIKAIRRTPTIQYQAATDRWTGTLPPHSVTCVTLVKK
jgi:alpha-L-arabinofuranosidase